MVGGRGQALPQIFKLLLSIAGPKIIALLGLALARTALSNRLARLQVRTPPWSRGLPPCASKTVGHHQPCESVFVELIRCNEKLLFFCSATADFAICALDMHRPWRCS